MPTLIKGVQSFKQHLEDAIRRKGVAGKNGAIRSSKPIQHIHDAIKSEFIDQQKIASERIVPKIGTRKGELTLSGFIKRKRQDVCIVPNRISAKQEDDFTSLIDKTADKFGRAFTERTIAINVRSQISSLDKNFDTLFERTIAEAQNLHMQCPKMVLAEVYMIAVPEYKVSAMDNTAVRVDFEERHKVEKYIKAFSEINDRRDTDKDAFKYERVCLLVVDFQNEVPIVHHDTESMIAAGMLDVDSKIDFTKLSWKGFASDLLAIHAERFPDDM
jgi:hypothetical protein